jgi:hypothetical protein
VIFFTRPSKQEPCSEGHKNDVCESKNLRNVQCQYQPQITKIASEIAVKIFIRGHSTVSCDYQSTVK